MKKPNLRRFSALICLAFWAFFANSLAAKPNPNFQNGLWVCVGPLPAANLDDDLFDAKTKKLNLTYKQIDQMASNHECKRLDSNMLKPISFQNASTPPLSEDGPICPCGAVLVSDGKHTGWTGSLSYLTYMQFHSVVASETK